MAAYTAPNLYPLLIKSLLLLLHSNFTFSAGHLYCKALSGVDLQLTQPNSSRLWHVFCNQYLIFVSAMNFLSSISSSVASAATAAGSVTSVASGAVDANHNWTQAKAAGTQLKRGAGTVSGQGQKN